MIPDNVLLMAFEGLLLFAAALGVLLAVVFVGAIAIQIVSVFMGVEGPNAEEKSALELLIMRFVQTGILFCLAALCVKLWERGAI